MAGAVMFNPSGVFVESDFVDWGGITDDFGNILTLENAWLKESGARKVMNAIGLSADVENRRNEEGWNGIYVKGKVYGPRSGVPSREAAPWRYYDTNGQWVWLDGPYPDSYLSLILQGKGSIAKWMFQHRNDANLINALRYISPIMYSNVADFENAVNSVNQSEIGTGGVLNTVNSGGGTVTGTGGNNVSEENTSNTYATGSTEEDAATIGDGGSGGNTPSGLDFNQLMQGSMDIGGVQIPYLVLGVGVIGLMFMMGGSKD